MGGGGRSNTTTQTSGVPDWLKPDVQRAFGKATEAHGSGALSQVATDPVHKAQLNKVANQGLEGANQEQLKAFYGSQLASGQGTLGSARADRARAAGLADTSAKLAAQDLQVKDQAFGQLRDQRQQELDAEHQGLQRLFGYYGSGAAGQKTEQSGGGGGK